MSSKQHLSDGEEEVEEVQEMQPVKEKERAPKTQRSN